MKYSHLEKIPIKIVDSLKKTFNLKTYEVEMIFVATILILVALITKKGLIEWVGVVAVFLNFGYLTIAIRLQEHEEIRVKKKEQVVVDCYKKLSYYNYSKELFWLIYFVLLGAWSALAGIFIFLLYGSWRKLWRKYHPL